MEGEYANRKVIQRLSLLILAFAVLKFACSHSEYQKAQTL